MEMSDERYLEIERSVVVFSFSYIQSLLTLISLLEGQGITQDELKTFVELKRQVGKANEKLGREKVIRERDLWNKNAPPCSVCSAPLMLRPIVAKKGPGNIKGYTSVWFCDADDCAFEEYGFEVAQDVYKQVLNGTYNADN